MAEAPEINIAIARGFEEIAALLEDQGANPYRVDAYRRGATLLRRLGTPVDVLFEREGIEGLVRLPAIGETLARGIRDYIQRRRLPVLDRLRGEHDAEALLATVPGIGRVLAARLHHDLAIDTLEDLEAVAHDGRLDAFPGFGPKRIESVRAALARRLQRRLRARGPEPPIAEILAVDRAYREGATVGSLPMVTPRRFNPRREAWLPVLHEQRGRRDYTALFSNTERAHRLGRTHDWVVIYYDGPQEGQCTVVTGHQGSLAGRRVVRGRERECEAFYRGVDRARERTVAGE